MIYAGIDLHKETHTAVMLGCWNTKLGEITFGNKPSKLPKLVRKVSRFVTEEKTTIYGLENAYGYHLLGKTADKLAKFAGIAPVNFSSAGKQALTVNFYFMAIQMIQVSTNEIPRNKVFREYYLKRIEEGKNKQQALNLHIPATGKYRVRNAEKPYRIPGAGAITAVTFAQFVLRLGQRKHSVWFITFSQRTEKKVQLL